jgi:transcriptional regulator with XRE-family HTH domain
MNEPVDLDTDIDELLGRRIRKRRAGAGLSMRGLARGAGLSAAFICEIEQGKRGMSVLSLCRIAYALDVPAATLIRGLGGKIVRDGGQGA